MVYYIPFNAVATSGSADAYMTIAAMQALDTGTSDRGRLRGLIVTPGGTPLDETVIIRLRRILDVSAGSAGTKTAIAAADLPRPAVAAPDPGFVGGVDYTAEPSTYVTQALWTASINDRGGLQCWFHDINERFEALRDQLIGLEATCKSAQSVLLSGTLIVESF